MAGGNPNWNKKKEEEFRKLLRLFANRMEISRQDDDDVSFSRKRQQELALLLTVLSTAPTEFS